MRVRRPETMVKAFESIRPHTHLVGLVSAAISDYPWIDELCTELRGAGASLAVSSLRAESATRVLLEALADSGQRSVTYAPEAGTEELRRAIGKPMTDQHLFDAVALAAEAGLREVKLYFMLGLPGETEDDVEAIGRQLAQLCAVFPSMRFIVSAAPLVPKPHTEFELVEMLPVAELRRRGAHLREALQKLRRVRLRLGSPRWAVVQATFSRGGRELGQVILQASLRGGLLQDVQAAMKAAGMRLDDYRSALVTKPWNVVDAGCEWPQ